MDSYKQLLKTWHFCLDCRQQDAWTFGGHSYCYECSEKRRIRAREWRKTHKDTKRVDRYNKHKAEYKCVYCGKELSFLDTGVACFRCTSKRENKRRSKYEYKRVGGMCYQCCNAEPLPGKKLCANCYDKNMEKLRMAWTAKEVKKYG